MPTQTKVNEKFAQLADQAAIDQTTQALEANGMTVFVVDDAAAAKAKALELIPEHAEIMNMTSMTLETASVTKQILETDRFASVRNQLNEMSDETELREKRQLGAAPDWAIGSAHAVTQQGQVVVASNTGSQLPAYAYGAQHVVWVIGTHKIVNDLDEAMQRVYEYSLPLEDARAQVAYGMGSNVSKLLIVNKEVAPDRITVILVNEKLGF